MRISDAEARQREYRFERDDSGQVVRMVWVTRTKAEIAAVLSQPAACPKCGSCRLRAMRCFDCWHDLRESVGR